MNVTYPCSKVTAVFDDENLIACAGLVPVMDLAEQAGLSALVADKVDLGATMVASAGVNPAGKVTAIVAGMATGADCIDDLQVIRAGGSQQLFAEAYAPATLGQFLREFTHGHAAQLSSAARAHLVELAARTPVLAGIEQRAFLDIDSMLRPAYGKKKQGNSYGHTKIAGKQVLRQGLTALLATLSTPLMPPVVTGVRIRAGKAASARGAASMIRDGIRTARRIHPDVRLMTRGDSAYGNQKVVKACLKESVEFSLTLAKNTAVTRAIANIDDDAWTPVHYPEAVVDPDTGELISDAEVAEITHTAFAKNKNKKKGKRGKGKERAEQQPNDQPQDDEQQGPRWSEGRGYRAAGGAPGPGQGQGPGRHVRRVAVPPVLHQQRRLDRPGRPDPPPARDHRDHQRRPDRRTAGAPTLRPLLRQL